MPIYAKKGRKATWRVVLSVQGHQREWVIRGSKADARAFEARTIRELEVGALAHRSAPKFSDFCLGPYAAHAAAHLRPSTWSVRRYHLATLIEHLGELRLTEFRTERIETYKQDRTDAGRMPRSVNNELAVLQAVLAYARKLALPVGMVHVIALPVVGRGRVTFWTEEQLSQLFAAVEAHAPELLPLVVFLANTGCRKGEALAAERTWIEVKRRLVQIPVNEFWQPKDNEPREVPVSDALLPWVHRALGHGGRWLFPARTGERFACWPKVQFDRARRLAGLTGGPHTLRHSFAAHFLAACPDMFLLSQILGHSETRTTKLYAHLLPTHLERARNAVNVAPATSAAAAEASRRWRRRA